MATAGRTRLKFRVLPPTPALARAATERSVEVVASGMVRIGRAGDLEVALPFPTISSQHARLVEEAGTWWLEDLGSANGTFVEDRQLAPGQREPLRPGQRFRLADVTLTFDGPAPAGFGGAPRDTAETTATLARRLVADLFGATRPAEVVRLVVERGPAAGLAVELRDFNRRYRVGRSAGADLVVDDERVAPDHAHVERRGEGVYLIDLGASSGVLVDGSRLGGERRMRDGDVFTLGETRIRVEDPEDKYLRALEHFEPSSEPSAPGGLFAALTPAGTRHGSLAGETRPADVRPAREDDARAVKPPARPAKAPARSGALSGSASRRPARPPARSSSAGALVAVAVAALAAVAVVAIWFMVAG